MEDYTICSVLEQHVAYAHRRTGWGVGGRGGGGGQLTPQHSDRYDNYSGKRQYICLTNRVTERNKYPST